jgi:predicted acyltransferase
MEAKPASGKAPKPRWESLDDLRGAAVFVMVPVNVAAGFAAIPDWFKHAPAIGLTLADLVMPTFLFSLGLSAAFSVKARVSKDGFIKTFLHALLRYAVLFAIGSIGVVWVYGGRGWETTQMLGATGLASFFLCLLPPWPRLGAASLILAMIEILRPLGYGSLINGFYDTGLAGPWGTPILLFIPVLASVLGERIKDGPRSKRLRESAILAGALGLVGGIAAIFFPISKHLLSLSYVLLCAGFASLLLCALTALREVLHVRLPLLGSLGRNPLLLYLIGGLLVLGSHALFPETASVAVAWACSLGALAICAAAAIFLDKKKIRIKL